MLSAPLFRPAARTGRLAGLLALTALTLTALAWCAPTAADPIAQVQGLPKAGLLVIDGGRPALAHNPDMPLIPASTMKLLTALAALETWGRDHRFETDFSIDGSGWLWVQGHADPYLVSEELDRIALGLRAAGIDRVAGIGLDDSFFDRDVEIAGRSSTDNPYDAPVTALAANFNTVSVIHGASGVTSAEPQTPLTATARRFGAMAGPGKQRVNLKQRPIALGYFGELLAAKLQANGIAVGEGQRLGTLPRDARRVYRHQNSRTLADMLVPTLKYSNNFVANSLFLGLAAPKGRGTVSMAAARRTMTDFARRRFGWSGFVIEDGAGLSRGNRLSPHQLTDVAAALAPYMDLMPTQEGNSGVHAKTGTLRGVSCYAGFVRRGGDWQPFALMINQAVDYNLRLRVASALVR